MKQYKFDERTVPQDSTAKRQGLWARLTSLLQYETLIQGIKYVIVGFTSAGIEFALLHILTTALQVSVIPANSIAYACSFIVNFLLNKFWSFASRGDMKKQLIRYSLLFGLNLAVSNTIMYVLTSFIHLPVMAAKVFAVGAVVSWNFVIYKKIIYT